MTRSDDSLSSDTAPDTPATHASVKSMTGHPPVRVTVSVWLPIGTAGTASRRTGRQALDQACHTHQPGPIQRKRGAGTPTQRPDARPYGRDLNRAIRLIRQAGRKIGFLRSPNTVAPGLHPQRVRTRRSELAMIRPVSHSSRPTDRATDGAG